MKSALKNAIFTLFAVSGLFFAQSAYAASVVSVTASASKIDEMSDGNPFSITVVFSDVMDTGSDPLVSLSPDLVPSGTLEFVDTSWSPDSTTYTINYLAHDADEIVSSVDADIIGAIGMDTVPATPVPTYTATNIFSVDTVTPVFTPVTILSVQAPVSTITEATIGSIFDIVVTFSAAMQTDMEPTIMLTPDLYTIGTLAYLSGNWSAGDTVFTAHFSVTDLDEEYASVDAQIVGAISGLPGIPPQLFSAPGLFSVDTKSPTVTTGAITVSGATGTAGAYKIGDTVTVTWDSSVTGDNNADIAGVTVDFSAFEGPSSVAATNASGGIWSATYTITEGALDTVSGQNISVTATDTAGNVTTLTDDTNATIDNKINGFTISAQDASINASETGAFAFDFANAEVGATYTYDINGSVTGSGTIGLANGSVTGIDVSALADGTLTLSVTITDVTGNVSTAVTDSASLDTVLPTVSTTISDAVITRADIGTTLTITLDFSEFMDPSFVPTLTFSPDLIASGALTFVSGQWTSGNASYVLTYTIADKETLGAVDVAIDAAFDLAGNTMSVHTQTDLFTTDTMLPPPAPTPTPSPTPSPRGGGFIPTPSPVPIPTVLPVVDVPTITPVVPVVVTPTTDNIFSRARSIASGEPITFTQEEVVGDPGVTAQNNSLNTTDLSAAAANAGISHDVYIWFLILAALILLITSIVRLSQKRS